MQQKLTYRIINRIHMILKLTRIHFFKILIV
uniref:Uncharacterized protein n=1 Tax=Myoviridae sp. ctCo31 TaxID=2825053 RepID=A0A8S5UML5_9CAUD|nr:MAG TPA: hypothetical protein [Myoviridae sp. ctCo31]